MATDRKIQPIRANSSRNEVAVEIVDLNKWFGAFHVLRDVDLRVMRGERIVICGPVGKRQVDVASLHQSA